MEYAAQWGGEGDPGKWAAQREAEGWMAVSSADHLWAWGQGTYPHLFVSLARMATATSTVRVSPAFANNLVRSPVEFAQASLSLAHASGGRYVAALGAGWEAFELRALGMDFPAPAQRARRFREAVLITRELLQARPCRFQGEFYDIDAPALGPAVKPAPPLAAAVAGDWTIRHVAPLVDRVELALPGPGNPLRGGAVDFAALARYGENDLRRAVELVREVNPQAPISACVFAAVGPESEVGQLRSTLAGGYLERLVGEAHQVAENLQRLARIGIAAATVIPMTSASLERLAPALVASGHPA
jgi:alkanesulfonate monooxygenase SsuD/methylene tetrahydromethanopterin reductase-like flavin-dependent oxidoreductase (luciferase family)